MTNMGMADDATLDHRAQGVSATLYQWRDPASIPPRQWLFGKHAIRRFISATVAPGGTGKSSNAMAETIAFVTGRNLLGDDIRTPGRAWYIGLEDPLEEYQRRVAAIALHHKIAPSELEGGLFLDSGRDQNFVIAREDRNSIKIAKPIVASIIDNILQSGIAHVTIDPFIASHAVRENDNMAIDAVGREWAHIADASGAAIELVHHVRKLAPDQELSADDSRGARALVDRARSVRLLSPMSVKEAELAAIEERRRFFRLINGKANMALPPDKTVWRQLVSVSLGNGQDGPDDLVGVAATWCWPDAFDDVTADDLRRVQVAVSDGSWRADVQAKAWVGNVVGDVLGLDIKDKANRRKVQTLIKTWVENGALRRETGIDPVRRTEHPFILVGDLVR
jgi:hypothetical protein